MRARNPTANGPGLTRSIRDMLAVHSGQRSIAVHVSQTVSGGASMSMLCAICINLPRYDMNGVEVFVSRFYLDVVAFDCLVLSKSLAFSTSILIRLIPEKRFKFGNKYAQASWLEFCFNGI